MPRLLTFAVLMSLAVSSNAMAQPAVQGSSYVIGQSYSLQSTVLGETRTINIYVPPGYHAGEHSYPVLYVLDGGAAQDFHHISGLSQLASVNAATQELIVVGIETRDRRRELAFAAALPRYREEWPSHGRSSDFRRYIAQDVIPFVERNWRVSGESALIGESLAGLFVIETLLREPALFDRYIAVDPSMWWDHGALARDAPDLMRRRNFSERTLWLATATNQPATEQLVLALRRGAPRLTLTHVRRPHETHATIYHPAALDALRALYPVASSADGPCPWWFCDNPAAQEANTPASEFYLWRPAEQDQMARPWVVLLTGASGMSIGQDDQHYFRAARWLNERGVDALIVDYQRAMRHVPAAQVGSPGERIAAVVSDAIAVERARGHVSETCPAGAIAWSLGAEGGWLLARDNTQTMRAVALYYPTTLVQSPYRNVLPILVLQGAADDVTAPAGVQALLATRPPNAASAQLDLFDGAFHGFDVPSLPREALPPEPGNETPPSAIAGTFVYHPGAAAQAAERLEVFLRQNGIIGGICQ